jgi:hypothetical protein
MAAPDYPSIRQAIATTLEGVSGITTVDLYDTATGTNNLPYAGIYLAGDTRAVGQEELRGSAGYAFQDEWHLSIRLVMPGPGADVTAQKLYEGFIASVRAAFDPNELLDPNGPGVVLNSQLTTSTLAENATDGCWTATFTLITLVIA